MDFVSNILSTGMDFVGRNAVDRNGFRVKHTVDRNGFRRQEWIVLGQQTAQKIVTWACRGAPPAPYTRVCM